MRTINFIFVLLLLIPVLIEAKPRKYMTQEEANAEPKPKKFTFYYDRSKEKVTEYFIEDQENSIKCIVAAAVIDCERSMYDNNGNFDVDEGEEEMMLNSQYACEDRYLDEHFFVKRDKETRLQILIKERNKLWALETRNRFDFYKFCKII